jgi:uncharacterized membrane protein
MKLTAMSVVLSVIGSLAVIIVLILIVGASLPEHHVASVSARMARSPDEAYRAVRDFQAYPSWRGSVKSVELLGAVDGRERFRENGNDGTVTYEVMQDEPGRRLVTRIVDQDLGYSGSWTYAFAPDGSGTIVTITEDADVTNVLFRFMSRFVFGHTATISKYLNDLSAHLGAPYKA